MQLARAAVISALLGAVRASSTCDNGNNCQRALLKTQLPSRDPLADCNSYFKATVTPKTVTVTVTGTATSSTATTLYTTTTTTNLAVAPGKRAAVHVNRAGPVEVRQVTVSPSAIPAYASPCSGAAKYSSACSCIGAIQTTVTVVAPVTTTTTSITVTTTTSTTATAVTTQALDVCTQAPLTWSTINKPSDVDENQVPGTFTNQQCCQVCYTTPGCAYWFMFDGDNACFVGTQHGATVLGQCPNGIETISYSDGLPAWGTGQCGHPNH